MADHAVSGDDDAGVAFRSQIFFGGTGEHMHLLLGAVRPHDKLLLPLLHAGVVDAHHNAALLYRGRCGYPSQRFASSTGQYDNTRSGSSVSEHLGQRFLLIRSMYVCKYLYSHADK